jgi:glycosyltransferase involved in cell wall biosynthesis
MDDHNLSAADLPHRGARRRAASRKSKTKGVALVSVVVPAFNAARTIGETLDSVLAQTYKNLEVLVVDDGSTDATSSIVRDYARRDPRVMLVNKPNAGVASARNYGLAVCHGDYVAPIDADDVWHPTKIEKQMAIMLNGGPDLGLVYTLYRAIDEKGNILWTPPPRVCTGWVLTQLVYVNFIGNGSSLLFRRAAALSVGAYDPILRAEGAEGCEDVLLQLRLAIRYQFGCVKEYLVGYRLASGSMSSRGSRMRRSYQRALALIRSECPFLPGFAFRWSMAYYETVLVPSVLRNGNIALGLQFLLRAAVRDPALTMHRLFSSNYGLRILKLIVCALAPRFAPSRLLARLQLSFREVQPSERIPPDRETLLDERLARLSEFDRALTILRSGAALSSPAFSGSVSSNIEGGLESRV